MLDYRVSTFLTLYREMNYRKTAEALSMTQPGVTQHIQLLEKYYGVRLFLYDGKRLHRTEAADRLKRHIDSLLARERAFKEQLVPSRQIHLDIGATKTIGEYVLPPVLRRYAADPGHTIQLTIDNTENLLSLLESSRLDFAIIEGVFDKQRYDHHLYKKERFVGICAQTHPFAGQTVSLDEVFRQTLVVREKGSGTRRLLEQAIADRGYTLDFFERVLSINHFSIITDLVAQGNAITFGYAPVASSHDHLSLFRVEDLNITGEFSFVYCDKEAVMPKIDLFLGQC